MNWGKWSETAQIRRNKIIAELILAALEDAGLQDRQNRVKIVAMNGDW
jgi:hypothetical protein